MSPRPEHDQVATWYHQHRRDLPWRAPSTSAWGVMVSEFMLQQTPVARVIPVWHQWVSRWPNPKDLAADAPADAIRMWGRLGYPRRALRLHRCAEIIAAEHGGEVPRTYEQLLALPGVGDYTASAIASFAFSQRHVVLDTNVRRVFARWLHGRPLASSTPTSAERQAAATVLPQEAEHAAVWAVATMELGSLICTPTAPACEDCPISGSCQWNLDGRPQPSADEMAQRASRTQKWHGTDRQMRGILMAALRSRHEPWSREEIIAHASAHSRAQASAAKRAPTSTASSAKSAPADVVDLSQIERCMVSLLADRLVELSHDDTFTLPGST